MDKLAVYNTNFFPEGTITNNIVSADDSLTRTGPLMTYDPILCNVLDEEVLETKDDTDDVSNEPICPQYSDVRPSRGCTSRILYMLFSDNGEFIHKCLNEISVLVKNELSAKLRQADIRGFFQEKSRKQRVDSINTSTGRSFLSAYLSLLNPSLCNIASGRNRLNSS